jgi:hypothetical protein
MIVEIEIKGSILDLIEGVIKLTYQVAPEAIIQLKPTKDEIVGLRKQFEAHYHLINKEKEKEFKKQFPIARMALYGIPIEEPQILKPEVSGIKKHYDKCGGCGVSPDFYGDCLCPEQNLGRKRFYDMMKESNYCNPKCRVSKLVIECPDRSKSKECNLGRNCIHQSWNQRDVKWT